jgi:hypothetical protein
MIRRPPLQPAPIDFAGSGSGGGAAALTAPSSPVASIRLVGSGGSAVTAAFTRYARGRSAGLGIGVKLESSLCHSGASDDFDDAIATSGHCTTAKLRMTSHRPMIYAPLLAAIFGTCCLRAQSYRNCLRPDQYPMMPRRGLGYLRSSSNPDAGYRSLIESDV